jgi:glycogen debranching enzyme
VYEALGDRDRAADLRGEAERLRAAFNEAFWNPEEDFFALALDGRKQRVDSVTSNIAHCLFSGIADEDKAMRVAQRLMAPDMYSGWGIRTLSSASPAYNPMSYHNGSVWPHDNAIAAAGLKRYGFSEEAGRICGGMFDVAAADSDFRLPELFCGFDRGESEAVVSYPVACIPQAWAAAAPFLLIQVMLGITPDAAANTLTIERPLLPDWLTTLQVRGLRLGDSRVALSFRRTSVGSTGFALLEQLGNAQVVMTA